MLSVRKIECLLTISLLRFAADVVWHRPLGEVAGEKVDGKESPQHDVSR